MFEKYSKYFRDIVKIALPIIMGNLGFILIGVGDVIVAGRHSTDTLAAISLANAIINCIVTFGIGILVSISPVLSNYRGGGKEPEKYFYSSLKFAVLLSLIISSVVFGCIPFIDSLGFEAKLNPYIKDYFFVTGFSIFGAYLHCMAKEFLQAFEIVVFPNILTIFCVFLNLVLNIIFVFGWGFIPEMGAIGLAISSLLVRYFMGIVLFLYCYKKVEIKYHKDFNYYKDLVKVGLPISLAILIEFVTFNLVTVLMGRISGIYAALQNIVCTITTVAFMVPLAISNATAVKVGFSNGAKDYLSLKNYAYTGIGMSLIFMTFAAICFGVAPGIILSLFTNDPQLIQIGVPIVYILCFFQVFDGMQISFAGVFKGLKQTYVVTLANFTGYWLVAIPLGCLLAFKCGYGLSGFWYALIIAAIILCIIMYSTLVVKLKKMEV